MLESSNDDIKHNSMFEERAPEIRNELELLKKNLELY